jgi:AraC-like DNA-binding protein
VVFSALAENMHQKNQSRQIAIEPLMARGSVAPQSIPELSEISERCGVPDIYYFNRLFRARHGMPPGTYAREARMLGLGKR